jgi:hypothetical protein
VSQDGPGSQCDSGHIRYAAEQSLFGLRILSDVKELFNIRRDWLAAAGTCNLCLRHSFYFRFPILDLRLAMNNHLTNRL